MKLTRFSFSFKSEALWMIILSLLIPFVGVLFALYLLYYR
jgi:uncharacterized membrane protein YqaE (UPF0057 family)